MAINFPNNPTIGQQVNSDVGTTYIWNGTVWEALTASTDWGSFMGKVQAVDLVTVGPYQLRMAPSGNRSLQIRNIQANSAIAMSTIAVTNLGVFGDISDNINLTKDVWTYIKSSFSFSARGQYQKVNFYDRTTYQSYRVTMTVGETYINNSITVEFLWQ